jgi:hypothetical protein
VRANLIRPGIKENIKIGWGFPADFGQKKTLKVVRYYHQSDLVPLTKIL